MQCLREVPTCHTLPASPLLHLALAGPDKHKRVSHLAARRCPLLVAIQVRLVGGPVNRVQPPAEGRFQLCHLPPPGGHRCGGGAAGGGVAPGADGAAPAEQVQQKASVKQQLQHALLRQLAASQLAAAALCQHGAQRGQQAATEAPLEQQQGFLLQQVPPCKQAGRQQVSRQDNTLRWTTRRTFAIQPWGAT
jgi:hypothetical protein